MDLDSFMKLARKSSGVDAREKRDEAVGSVRGDSGRTGSGPDGSGRAGSASAGSGRAGSGLAGSERRRSRGAIVRTVIGLVIALVGAALFLYPIADSNQAQNQAYETIERAIVTDTSEAPSGTTPEGKRQKDGDPAYQYLSDYNQKVRDGTAESINDPWGIGSNTDELSSVGLSDGIVGSITIDRLNETIPLYLGASKDHLSVGAGIVAGTSMPLGGEGNNCVIAAHRGAWHGLTMFRDIEDIQMGDLIVINTPWDTLTYRASSVQIITPDDVDAVKPQAGKDLVTLLTCHPYGHNYQRYLVICERVQGEDAAPVTTTTPTTSKKTFFDYIQQATLPSESSDLTAERWVRAIGLLIILAAVVALAVYWIGRLVSWVRRRHAKKNSWVADSAGANAGAGYGTGAGSGHNAGAGANAGAGSGHNAGAGANAGANTPNAHIGDGTDDGIQSERNSNRRSDPRR